MPVVSQKDAMIWCDHQAGGICRDAAQLYADLEDGGQVWRESNVTPRDPYDYGTILWHTGRKLGWFDSPSNAHTAP